MPAVSSGPGGAGWSTAPRYSEPFLWHCSQDQIAGFFSSCGLAVLEDLGLDELISLYTKRDKGWLEATPSLRLVVSENK